MTLKGVFFLLGQYIYGGNCYFVNGPKVSRSLRTAERRKIEDETLSGDGGGALRRRSFMRL